jgi:hypothetical protein
VANSVEDEVQPVLFPYLATKRTTLRPTPTVNGELTYDLLEQAGLQKLPDRDDFISTHTTAIAMQFMVEQRGDVVGISSLRHLDMAGGHVRADIFTDPSKARHGVPMEVMFLTVNYAFAMWNLRKVYFWTPDDGFGSFAQDQLLIRREGTLPDHLFTDGQPADMHIFAIYRDQWDEHGLRLLERLVPAEATASV